MSVETGCNLLHDYYHSLFRMRVRFSVNDGEADETGEYKARKRAREVFGDRFVVLQTGEQRPDHTGYHEGVGAAQEIRKRNLHMLFNLPGNALSKSL